MTNWEQTTTKSEAFFFFCLIGAIYSVDIFDFFHLIWFSSLFLYFHPLVKWSSNSSKIHKWLEILKDFFIFCSFEIVQSQLINAKYNKWQERNKRRKRILQQFILANSKHNFDAFRIFFFFYLRCVNCEWTK